MRQKSGIFVLIFCLLLSGCAGTASNSSAQNIIEEVQEEEVPSASGEIFAMDTYMSITCYGQKCQEALDASLAEIERLDELLSVGNENSEISQINAHGQASVSADTAKMIEAALELSQNTSRAFDPTIYPLMELWGFTSQDFAVPAEERLQELLSYVDAAQVRLDTQTNTVTLLQGQGIDLGGIAKGFTSSRLMEIFEEYDLVSGMVSLGGNVQCYKRKTDGSLWRCGIQDPLNPDDSNCLLGILSIEDTAVITSGAYERYFIDEKTGESYHHILDPLTGYPANAGLISVTIVSSNGMLADGLSTACYVMGLERSIEYWRASESDFDMILMSEDGTVYITQPLADSFTSDYEVQIVLKGE